MKFLALRLVLRETEKTLRDLTLTLEAMREDHIKYPQLRLPEMQTRRLLKALELAERL